MRKLVSILAAFLLLVVLAIQAQDDAKGKGGPPAKGGKGGGGGGGPKNLQILTQATLLPTMQSFVPALGLADKGGCTYCHVEDRSSDEKKQKLMARNMIAMVREINMRFQDGKQHVTCYTCHRGNTTPEMTP